MKRRDPTVIVLAALVAGSALVVDPGGWQTFGPGKWLVITATAWAALSLAVLAGVAVHRWSAFAWAAVLAWAGLTSFTALEPLSALLGTPDRRLGLVGLLTMAAAYMAGQKVAAVAERRLLARTIVLSLIGLGVYGLAEAAGLTVTLTTTTDRLGSTYGSPAYLGAALALFVPPAFGLAVDGGERPAWRAAAGVAALTGIGLLAASGTRAALVGLVAAALVTAGAWFPWVRRHPALTAAAIAVATVVVVLGPLGSRLADLPGGGAATGRADEWAVALSAVAERPYLGAGLEGYRVVFPSVVDAAYVRQYGRSTITDRAHSGPLDMAVALGVAGAAAWLAGTIWLTGRSARSAARIDPASAGLAAGVVGLLAQELFLFPTLEVGVAGWAVAGVVVTATRQGERLVGPLRARVRTTVAAGVAGLATLLALAGILDVAADHRAAGARASGTVAGADEAAALRPDSFRYPLLGADIAARRREFGAAASRLGTARGLAPLDPALRVAELRLLAAMPEDPTALTVAAAAARADPNHPDVRLLHGDLLAAAGRAGEAERAWLAAEYLDPANPEIPLRLAFLYLDTGAVDAAARAVERLRLLAPDHPRLVELEELVAEA